MKLARLASIWGFLLPGCGSSGSETNPPADSGPPPGDGGGTGMDGAEDGPGGKGGLPAIQISGCPADFGASLVGDETTRTVTVANAGDAPLAVSGVRVIEDDDPGEFSAPPAPFTLPPGETRDLEITHGETDGEADAALLAVSSDDPNMPEATCALTSALPSCVDACVPLGGGECADPTAIDFGTVSAGGAADAYVVLTNPCDGTATVSAASTSEPALFTVETEDSAAAPVDLPFGLDGGAANALYVHVTLAAPAAAGAIDELLMISTDAPDFASITVPLTATVEEACVPTGADEAACNGVDDDCDDLVDEDYAPYTCTLGGCTAPSTCIGGVEACDPVTATEVCDGGDNNCDGAIDEGCDDDDDDWCDETMGIAGTPPACPNGGGDCDDGDAAVSPGEIESCNGIDDDCDGDPDDGFPIGAPCATGLSGVCAAGLTACDGTGGTTCEPLVAATSEDCDDVDDDCDGVADNGCDDDDDDFCDDLMVVIGSPATCPNGGGDCDDFAAAANPGEAEVCDGADNDCDTSVDEGSNGCGGACALAGTPGLPCDGADTDLCPDDTWTCADENTVECPTGADNGDPCGGGDDDCNGTADDDGSNACAGSCTLTDVPGALCDGADTDLCDDDAIECSGLNATACSVGADNGDPCDGLVDDDCDGTIDNDGSNACGGSCVLAVPPGPCDGSDTDLCLDDTATCDGLNATDCSVGADNGDPCDGVDDDDCDGIIDNDGSNVCGGSCVLPDTPGTACDGADSDLCPDDTVECDGFNGTRCTLGADNGDPCNGADDDCNLVDDDDGSNACGGSCPLSPVPGPCDGGDTDLCPDDTASCVGLNSTICSLGADNGDPCDGLIDDDCDGTIDNDGSNPCLGSCVLVNPPGTPCDGPDADLCIDDAYACAGLNDTACSTGADNPDPIGPPAINIGPEVVDAGATDAGQYASIAVDASGAPHISYYNVSGTDLRYAVRDMGAGTWSVFNLASGATQGLWTGIALTGSTADIVLYDSSGSDFSFITNTGGTWTPAAVIDIDASSAGQYGSLVRNPTGGALHAGYYDTASSGHCRYATCPNTVAAPCTSAANWATGEIDNPGDQVGQYSSIDVDPADGSLHVSYYNVTDDDLWYAECTAACAGGAANWTKVAVEVSGNDVGRWSSIALGAGRPHIAYYDTDLGTLKHAYCTSGCTAAASWTVETVTNNDASTDYGQYASIAVAPPGTDAASDRVHVSYYENDIGGGRLEYAVRAGGAWIVSVLDDPAVNDVGQWTTLAMDTAVTAPAQRYVHVGYYDATGTQLKYVRFDQNSVDGDCDGW